MTTPFIQNELTIELATGQCERGKSIPWETERMAELYSIILNIAGIVVLRIRQCFAGKTMKII